MTEFKEDLIVVYKQLLREVEGGQADMDVVLSALRRNGIEVDDDLCVMEAVDADE